jgi:hypothetical protein
MHALTIRRSTRLGAALVAAATLALAGTTAGCSADDDKTTTTGTAQSTSADQVTVSDAWVKAVPSGMTGAFGVLANDGDREVRLESVSSDRAGMVELHETVSDGSGGMTMRPKEGGFTIAAGDEHELAPGGDHIMLMGVTGALAPGEEIELVLHFEDGSTKTVTALVKDFTGADETYSGDAATPSMDPEMDSEMDSEMDMESGSDGS